MIRLALGSLRRRKVAALGGFVTLFLAAAMVCACGVLLETGLRGTSPAGRFAGTPVVVTGDQQIHWVELKHKDGGTQRKVKSKDLAERVWLPPAIGARLRSVRGADVVGDRTFTTALFGSGHRFVGGVDGRPVYGHNWSAARLTPYAIVSGHAPRSAGEIVLDAGLAAQARLAVGDRIGVQSTRSPAAHIVVGIVRPRSPVTQESAVFFADAEAASLADHGASVTAYGVFGASADALRDALRATSARVLTGSGRAAAAQPGLNADRTRLISMSGAIGGTALIVAVLVVVGMFSLSIQQRRQELALLRAVGATPRQLRRSITCEALVLGLPAAAAGAVAGVPLSDVVHADFVAHGAVPDALRLVHGPFPVVGGALVTVVAALAASRISARRVSRIRPVQALTEADVEQDGLARVRSVAGTVTFAGAVLVSLLLTRLHTEPAAIPVSYLGALLWIVAIALLGPVLARVGVTVLALVWRTSPVGGFLAGTNSRAHSRRTASVVTPMALLLGMATTILLVPATIEAAVQAQTRDGLSADWVIASDGPGVPPGIVAQVRATAGVSAAVSAVQSTIWVGRDKRSAQGVTGPGLTTVIDPDVSAGSLARLGDDDIAMSSVAAQGRHVGARVDATLGDGTKVSLTLVAVYRRGLGFGDTLVSFGRLVHHVDAPLAQQVFVAGPVARSTLLGELAAVPGLRVVDRSGYRKTLAARHDPDDAVTSVFLVMIIAFCGIALLTTLALATGVRAREFSLLRFAGATPRQVRSMLGWELALAVVLAVVLAAIAAGSTLTGFSIGMTGAPTPALDPLGCLGLVLAAILLGAIGVFVPARSLLRRGSSWTSTTVASVPPGTRALRS